MLDFLSTNAIFKVKHLSYLTKERNFKFPYNTLESIEYKFGSAFDVIWKHTKSLYLCTFYDKYRSFLRFQQLVKGNLTRYHLFYSIPCLILDYPKYFHGIKSFITQDLPQKYLNQVVIFSIITFKTIKLFGSIIVFYFNCYFLH